MSHGFPATGPGTPIAKNFLWVSGIWRVPPPGRQWVPGHWDQVEGGWQWVPGFWHGADTTELQYLPAPPAPIAEATPPAPNESSAYVPGCWVWRDTRYLWRPGYYMEYPPGWVWSSPGYNWTPAGYVFVDGYWDRPFRNRGLLFAPVAIARRFWGRPNWVYQPSYVVADDFLTGALFVNANTDQYYFGDYFEPSYRERGFVPWVDFRVGRGHYDPLYSYYRWEHRDNPRWARDLHSLYVARSEGKAVRPPRTLAQQATLLQRNANAPYVTAVNSLNRLDRTAFKLTPVPKAQLTELRNHATQLRRAGQERGQMESRLRQEPVNKTAPMPRVAKFQLPRVATAVNTPEKTEAPPLPRVPQPQARTAPQGEIGRPGDHRPGAGPAARQPEEQPRPTPRPGTERQPLEQTQPTPRPTGKPEESPRTPTTPNTVRPPEERPRPSNPPAPQPRPEPRATPEKPAQRPPEPRLEPRPPAPPAAAHTPPERAPAAPPRPEPKPEPRPAAERPAPPPPPPPRKPEEKNPPK